VFARAWRASHTSVRATLASASGKAWKGRRVGGEDSAFLSVGPLSFSEALLTVQQAWEGGPRVSVAPGKRGRRAIDFACGLAVSATASGAEVLPVARARLRLPLPGGVDAVLRLAPATEAVLKVDVPISRSGLRLGAALHLPWTNVQFDALALGAPIPWKPRFSCRLFSAPDAGLFHFSPRGITLTERSLVLGRDTVLRGSAALDFPQSFPFAEEEMLRLRVDKLSLSTRLRYGDASTAS